MNFRGFGRFFLAVAVAVVAVSNSGHCAAYASTDKNDRESRKSERNDVKATPAKKSAAGNQKIFESNNKRNSRSQNAKGKHKERTKGFAMPKKMDDFPDHYIRIQVFGCRFDVRVNDGPVFSDQEGNPVVTQLPVNSWLVNGKNELSAILSPLPKNSSFSKSVSVKLEVFSVGNNLPGTENRIISKILFSHSDIGSGKEFKTIGNAIHLNADFELTQKVPVWNWLNGHKVESDEKTKLSLVKETKRFHALLKKKDMDGVTKFIAKRDMELAVAQNLTFEKKRADSRKSYEEQMDDSLFKLQDLELGYLELRVFGNGRLARLDAFDGGPPIIYEGIKEPVWARFPLIFYQSSKGRWEVIR